MSIAAGPVGQNAEDAAGIFSYSRTKGLFAGVSLEGSTIIETRDANEKLYGQRFTAKELLGGTVTPPPAAQPLMTVLNSRVFARVLLNNTPASLESFSSKAGPATPKPMFQGETGSSCDNDDANQTEEKFDQVSEQDWQS